MGNLPVAPIKFNSFLNQDTSKIQDLSNSDSKSYSNMYKNFIQAFSNLNNPAHLNVSNTKGPDLTSQAGGIPLNNDVKKVNPDGSFELFSNVPMVAQMLAGGAPVPTQGAQAGQSAQLPAATAAVTTQQQTPLPATTQQNILPTIDPRMNNIEAQGVPTPPVEQDNYFSSLGNDLTNFMKSPMFQIIMGQMGSALAAKGSGLDNIGQLFSNMGSNRLYNQMLSDSLKKKEQEHPFVSSSADLGLGVAGLSPEQQTQILGATERKKKTEMEEEMMPLQKGLTMSQIIKNLSYKSPTKSNRVEVLNVDEKGKRTAALDKRKWLLDPDGNKLKHLGHYTGVAATGASTKMTLSELGKVLAPEFFPLAKANLLKNANFVEVAPILEAMTGQDGSTALEQTVAHLKPEEITDLVTSIRSYAQWTENPAATENFAKRLEDTIQDSGGYDVGDVQDIEGVSMKYKGGDFKKIENWEKVE
ncbi:MAG: hypothetical protein GY804_01055 [Alphaproteobacteria bacterium]|nr:hypothetical protein [Alphaproteobacteria bacterium]